MSWRTNFERKTVITSVNHWNILLEAFQIKPLVNEIILNGLMWNENVWFLTLSGYFGRCQCEILKNF